jgi:hypothetical protein
LDGAQKSTIAKTILLIKSSTRTHSLAAKMNQTRKTPDSSPPAIYARADEEYQAYTGQVSLISRTLALTAIAVIWLFASQKQGSTLSPFMALRKVESAQPLLFSLAFTLGTLILDLLQYVWGSIAWATYRWSLDQILINDSFDPLNLSLRVRVAWASARLCGLVKRFEYSLGHPASDREWPKRREQLRKDIKSLMAGEGHEKLLEVANSTWAPLVINRIVSILYVMKILSLLISYGFLATYLFD